MVRSLHQLDLKPPPGLDESGLERSLDLQARRESKRLPQSGQFIGMRHFSSLIRMSKSVSAESTVICPISGFMCLKAEQALLLEPQPAERTLAEPTLAAQELAWQALLLPSQLCIHLLKFP